MIRSSCNLRFLAQSQKYDFGRAFSAQPAVAEKSLKFQEEWDAAKPFSAIPTIPIFELIRGYLPGGKFYKIGALDLHKKLLADYGKLVIMPGMFGNPAIMLSFEPEDFEKVFRNDTIWPIRRNLGSLEYYRKNLRPDVYAEYGGLFNGQGENWYNMRTVVNPVMMQPKAMKMYIPKVEDISDEFLTMIAGKRDAMKEVPANFSDFINLWSLESITCIVLDKRLGILSDVNPDKNATELIKNIRKFFELTLKFDFEPSIWKYYKTPAFMELMKVHDSITEILLRYVDEAVERFEKNPVPEENDQSILEKLLLINKKIAVVMAADSLMAGVDTTASATIGVMYCLAKNPEKQQKLREELMKILPDKDSRLTPENMKNMPYLRACIKEGTRLYPATLGNMRCTGNDVVLQGYQVPKGVDVAMASMVLTAMDENYPRAKEYIPERWIKNEDHSACPNAKSANPFTFLPFGFGARMCVGRRLADLEIEVLISKLIRNYQIEWHHADLKIKSVLVNIPEGDLKFRMTEL